MNRGGRRLRLLELAQGAGEVEDRTLGYAYSALANLALDQAFDEFLPLVEAQVRLARNELVTECGMPVFVPVRRDFFKFAMLNLISATHGRMGEAGGTRSHCHCR